MAVSETYLNQIVTDLSRVAPIRVQRLFGGIGLYVGDQFFGLIVDDQLYFHTTPETRGRYLDAGMEAFSPYGDDGMALQFYRVPHAVITDHFALCEWMNHACGVLQVA